MAYYYNDNPTYCATCGTELEQGSRFCANCGAVMNPQMHEPGGQSAVEYMGFWIRVPAALIDFILLVIVNSLVGGALGLGDNLAFGIVTLLITWTYHVAFITARGQTLGKMALGIQVVNAQGNTPSIGQALLRETIGKFLSGIALGLGYLWVGWDKEKRGWHDHIGGAYVVRKQRGDSAQGVPYE